MSELFLFIALTLSLLVNGLMVYLNYREKQKILDRDKARDLEEYKYYEQDYPREIKHKEKVLKNQRKAKKAKPNPKDTKISKIKDMF